MDVSAALRGAGDFICTSGNATRAMQTRKCIFLSRDLMFEIWSFPGAWCLDLAAFIEFWDLDSVILSSAFPLSTSLPVECWLPKAALHETDSPFQKSILRRQQNREPNPGPPINETTSPPA